MIGIMGHISADTRKDVEIAQKEDETDAESYQSTDEHAPTILIHFLIGHFNDLHLRDCCCLFSTRI